MSYPKVFIYGLVDPRNPKEIRYIGKTKRSLNIRLIEHVSQSKRYRRYSSNWVKSLLSSNVSPQIVLLEECNEANWEEREKFYIKFYKDKGSKLTNFEEGGNVGETFKKRKAITSRLKSTTKTVLQLDFLNNVIKEYPSCASIERELGFNRHVIAACCRGKQTKSYNYRWCFKNNPDFLRTEKKHTKKVKVIFKKDNTEKVFISITECCKYLKLSRSYVDNILKGNRINDNYKISYQQ